MKTMDCPNHGIMQVVGEDNDPVAGVTHYHLACGCTLERAHEAPEEFHVKVGDVVRWNDELFRLDDIKVEDDEVWACIINTDGDEEVLLSGVEYVGEDKLTGCGMKGFMSNFTSNTDIVPDGAKQSWSPPPTSKAPSTQRSANTRKMRYSGAPKKKGSKGLAISTHGLINDEVSKLKKNDNVIPFKASAEEEKTEEKKEDKPKGFPKRRGDW